jgi:hypothetical protein
MEKVLVSMDIHSGLPEVLEIEWQEEVFRNLDYLGLPFRCTFCRSTGHLRRDCQGFKEEEEETEDISLTSPSPDCIREQIFPGLGSFQFPQEEPEPTVLEDSITGKIKNICPYLFSSLTQLEIEALEESYWLKSHTSGVRHHLLWNIVSCKV